MRLKRQPLTGNECGQEAGSTYYYIYTWDNFQCVLEAIVISKMLGYTVYIHLYCMYSAFSVFWRLLYYYYNYLRLYSIYIYTCIASHCI